MVIKVRIAAVTFMLLWCVTAAWADDHAGVSGVVYTAEGTPKPQTSILLKDGSGAQLGHVTTDATGHFDFSNVADGSYVVMATEGEAVLGSTMVTISGHKSVQKDITLSVAPSMKVVVGQSRQNIRNSLSPTTGTSAYKIDASAIESLPQGSDTSFDKVLLQTPGVAEDSAASGSLHIRGEHANLQYRLNGILLPDGINGFGDTIDSHIIDKATLLDGTLPAQYGFRTAAVVDIDTKDGFQNGGTGSIMGGSHGTIQPSVSYGGTLDDAEYFLAASHLSSDLGIENTTSSHEALHDHTEQNKQFGYASYMLNPDQRLEVIAGNSINYYQIPNSPNQTTTYQLNGSSAFNSSNLNERQFESNQYATIAWQGDSEGLTAQVAPYIRSSELHFRPDVAGDLLFNGLASDVKYTDLATGLQNDNSWKINGEHTLRAGLTVQNDHVQTNNTSLALQTDASGNPVTDINGNNIATSPIINNHTNDSQLYGVYAQDEWKITHDLTMNYGARFDQMVANVSDNQISPRLGFVYKATDTTTLHAGYARYFTPPPQELVSNADIGAFANTTNAPSVTQNNQVKPERSHNFDVGLTQKLGDHWQIGVDGYYKLVHDLLDEGQFGSALILTPFNYQHGYIYGSEFTASYTNDKLKAYGNFAFSRAMGENIVSAQFNFTDPAELAYIANHYVHLDHDQTFTASGGVTYDVLDDTTLGLDAHAGSGLRSGFANTSHLPAYATFDLSILQNLDLIPNNKTTLRMSVINLFDSAYEIRDGSGIGVGAPQWGQRIGFFAGLSQQF